MVRKHGPAPAVHVNAVFYRQAGQHPGVISALLEAAGGRERMHRCFGLLLVGIPQAQRGKGEGQLAEILSLAGREIPAVPYRKFVGEHASASAVATVLAVEWVRSGALPPFPENGRSADLRGKGILVLGLGNTVTAMEILPGPAGCAQSGEVTGP